MPYKDPQKRKKSYKKNLPTQKAQKWPRDPLLILAIKHYVMSVYSFRISKTKIPCCACCGEKMLIFLTIDHIRGRQKQERKNRIGGKDLRYKLLARGFPKNYQVLCFNCNSAKSDTGICPHKWM